MSHIICHNRFGYPNNSILNSIICSLHLTACKPNSCLCKHCICCKMNTLPCLVSFSCSMYPLELIYADVCSSAPKTSINGFNYYVSFVDDYSKYTWLYHMTLKSVAFSVFKPFKCLVDNLLSTRIKKFFELMVMASSLITPLDLFFSLVVYFNRNHVPTPFNRMALLNNTYILLKWP